MKKFSDLNKPNGFVILKPGFLKHTEEFEQRLKDNNWEIIDKKRKKLSKNQAMDLYKMHSDKPFFAVLSDYMASDDCMCYKCHKSCMNPVQDMGKIKDGVRKDWGVDDMKNAMHSSDSLANVSREADICFGEGTPV